MGDQAKGEREHGAYGITEGGQPVQPLEVRVVTRKKEGPDLESLRARWFVHKLQWWEAIKELKYYNYTHKFPVTADFREAELEAHGKSELDP